MSVATHRAGGADPAGRGQGLAAGAGRHVEHPGAGRDAGGVEHALGRFAEPVLQRRPPAVPGLGGVLPLLAGGGLVLGQGRSPSVSSSFGTSSNWMGARSPADRGRFRLALRQTTTPHREATMGPCLADPAPGTWLVGHPAACAMRSGQGPKSISMPWSWPGGWIPTSRRRLAAWCWPRAWISGSSGSGLSSRSRLRSRRAASGCSASQRPAAGGRFGVRRGVPRVG